MTEAVENRVESKMLSITSTDRIACVVIGVTGDRDVTDGEMF